MHTKLGLATAVVQGGAHQMTATPNVHDVVILQLRPRTQAVTARMSARRAQVGGVCYSFNEMDSSRNGESAPPPPGTAGPVLPGGPVRPQADDAPAIRCLHLCPTAVARHVADHDTSSCARRLAPAIPPSAARSQPQERLSRGLSLRCWGRRRSAPRQHA